MAVNALYMSSLGNLLNEKDESFIYKRMYFSLKTRINDFMWDPETSFYHDLDANGVRLPHKTIAGFWPLLAEIPNEEKAESLISHLTNPATFGTQHPFPTLSMDHPKFSQDGDGFCGSVYPPFNFMVTKGLERYQRWELARESAIRHLYFILDGFTPGNLDENMEIEPKNDVWDSYRPCGECPAANARHCFLPYVGLSTVAMMIENVIGIIISLPKKTVDWVIPNMEAMGIENLSLKRNLITILSNKSNRGWEILLESEKLYYFTINILGKKKKTLPIPSGKCSMLVDKL
jgi:neutral trehalase